MTSGRIVPLIALLTACNTGTEPKPIDAGDGISLARFESCESLQDYVVDSWTEELVQSRYGWYGGGWLAEGDAEAGGDDGGGGGDSPTDWSDTNVQEEGVDEPDMVKTDGDYMYIAHGRVLDIVDSWPAEDAELVSRVDIGGTPSGLFLEGDKALVISQVWQYDYDEGGDKDEPEHPEGDRESYQEGTGEVPAWDDGTDAYYRYSTRLTVVDVSDRAEPVVVREIDLEGYYSDARRIGDDVYVVSNTWASMPNELWEIAWSDDWPELDYDAEEAEREAIMSLMRTAIRPQVEAVVGDMSLARLLPEMASDGGAPELLSDCTDIYHPPEDSSPSVLSLTHVDLGDDGQSISSVGLMADGWEVYASEDHLYVAQTSWWWWGWWDDMDNELSTVIHRFDLEAGESTYSASGKVPGWLLNSYSMGEHEGYLRVATTDLGWWGETETEPANRVVVLEEQDGVLETVGEVDGIAPNEQIYSCRFMGDVGYMVTFERVDPLFTLDLSDPTDPSVIGELKVTGYSSYLHPAGEDHLLSVGMEADEDGWTTGFAVSLFDISDLSDPTLADRIVVESDDWSYSESLWDPHAFTYHRDTLAVPLYTYDYDDGSGEWDDFSGLMVVDTDLEGGALTEIGRVDHDDIADATECPTLDSGEDDWYDDCYDGGGYSWMRRSVVIEDWLYSVSNMGIAVSPLTEPDNVVAEVVFYPEED